MSGGPQVIETGHTDIIVSCVFFLLDRSVRAYTLNDFFNCSFQHDAQFDFYGKRVATCSSDRVIRVFDVDETGEYKPSAELVR